MEEPYRKPERIEDYLPLVASIARRYAGRCDMDDLIGAGNLGLVKAFARYRAGDMSFATYATWWILNDIRLEVVGGRLIRIPREVFQNVGRGRRGEPIRGGHLRESVDQAIRILDAKPSDLGSLDCDLFHHRPDPDDIDDMRTALSMLMPRSRQVLTLRFGLDGSPPMFYRDIGRAVGLSHEGVRKVEKAALTSLRERLSPPQAEVGP